MADQDRVVHLPAGDAVALLRLLSGYAAVLRGGELSQDLATGGIDLEAGGGGPWREQVAAQAEAACGLLRQSLDGFDPSTVLSPAEPSAGAPAVGGPAEG